MILFDLSPLSDHVINNQHSMKASNHPQPFISISASHRYTLNTHYTIIQLLNPPSLCAPRLQLAEITIAHELSPHATPVIIHTASHNPPNASHRICKPVHSPNIASGSVRGILKQERKVACPPQQQIALYHTQGLERPCLA